MKRLLFSAIACVAMVGMFAFSPVMAEAGSSFYLDCGDTPEAATCASDVIVDSLEEPANVVVLEMKNVPAAHALSLSACPDCTSGEPVKTPTFSPGDDIASGLSPKPPSSAPGSDF